LIAFFLFQKSRDSRVALVIGNAPDYMSPQGVAFKRRYQWGLYFQRDSV
jgi:hypothetical protein